MQESVEQDRPYITDALVAQDRQRIIDALDEILGNRKANSLRLNGPYSKTFYIDEIIDIVNDTASKK